MKRKPHIMDDFFYRVRRERNDPLCNEDLEHFRRRYEHTSSENDKIMYDVLLRLLNDRCLIS